MVSETAPKGRLVGQAVSALRSRVASGEWPVGSRIPTEPELCGLLGVGRSTVREAVRALATLGMVEPLTARGTFVRSATPAPTLLVDALSAYAPAELVGLRRALDVEAAQSAAARWDPGDLEHLEDVLDKETSRLRGRGRPSPDGVHCARFHSAVTRASGNRLLTDLDASLASAVHATGLAEQIATSVDVAVCLDEHDRILTAIRARDVGAAAHLMALHVDAAFRGLGHEPVVMDLTALVRTDQEQRRPEGRGIA